MIEISSGFVVILFQVTIANVPLVCYASSFVTATALKVVDKRLGRVVSFLFTFA